MVYLLTQVLALSRIYSLANRCNRKTLVSKGTYVVDFDAIPAAVSVFNDFVTSFPLQARAVSSAHVPKVTLTNLSLRQTILWLGNPSDIISPVPSTTALPNEPLEHTKI